ncbi:MAG: isopenicillin N synthase family oxygenase [Alphaproteobacteria bacterium]|nr:isopenicillin N synthase family oxygenase [Alphaproteobacteria bacterium]
MAKPTLQVPAIDIAPFLSGDPEGKRAVVDAVRSACRDIGFLVIAGHGLSTDDLARAFTLTRNFFDLPQETKNKWHPTGPSKQRGYHAFETRGLAHTMDANVPLDLRETVFLGPIDDQRAHYEALAEAQPAYWPNTIPTEPQGVDDAAIAIYRGFERLSADLLRIFALALDMPEDHFADKIDRHFSILSCHHYPALTEPPLPNQLRTGAHTDFGAMTILAMTEATGGLEVNMPDGSWAGVQAAPHELVVNLGDMMARWTNDRWRSTLHRVVNPPDLADAMSRRQSIGYFMHPNYDAKIECFPTCLETGDSPRYPAITAGEHIAMKIEKSHNA